MKTARFSVGGRRGDAERYSQAFFIVGALVVFAVVFFLGFQVGRIVEKNVVEERTARKDEGRKKEDIRREMSAYSEEAVRVPVVTPPPPPPDADEELKKSEANATFPDTLTRKDPQPQPLVKPKPAPEPAAKKRYLLQAGALKNRDAAESLKGKLEKGGFHARIIHVPGKGNGKDLYKIRVGPHGSKEEALKAMKEIRTALRVDVILIPE